MARPTQASTALTETRQANPPSRGGNHNKGAKHLTAAEVADILRWHTQGLTQQAIADRLGRPNSQGQVSQVITKYGIDNTPQAKQILRGGAASMALNIVRRGQPKDQVQALKGLGVLEEQQQAGLVIQVGGHASDVKVAVLVQSGQTFASHNATVSTDIHSLTVDAVSDKTKLC